MLAKTMLLTGAAGLAALVSFAAPAAAQGYPYGGYNQGYGNQGGVLGAIVNQVLGYGRYPYGNYGYGRNSYQGQSTAVAQCARAAEARLNYGGYGNYNQGYGNYNQGYGYGGYGQGGYGQGGYGQGGYRQGGYGYNGYNSGGARVVGISRVDRKSYGYRVYGVATDRFGSGYGYQGGYGQPSLRFDCKVEYNGRVRDVNVNRNMADYRYGYGW